MSLLLSVFNLNFNLELPRYGLIYRSEFIFNLILMNLCLISGYLSHKKKSIRYSPWILTLIFCLYAFWDEDYFNFAENFKTGLTEFRDILYPSISSISLGSYIIFRLFIWGTALWLYYISCKRFNLNLNISIYVFIFFFLLTFSYARASLGMTSYYCGLSFLLISKKDGKFYRICCAIILFVLAFMAHRSMAFLICLTPICYIRFSKWTIWLFVILIPGLLYVINVAVGYVMSGALMGDSSVSQSANQYVSYDIVQEMNWKYKLVTNLHYWGFYIGLLSILIKIYFNKNSKTIPDFIMRLIPQIFIIQVIAFCLINSSSFGLWIIGYRFLYMTGIPLCIIIAMMYQNKIINSKWLKFIYLCPVLYSESFIIGKILSLS